MYRSLDEILLAENPEVVARAKAKAEEILLNIRLAEVLELLEKEQTQKTNSLKVFQPGFIDLKKQIEAIGGKVKLNIELPNGKHKIFAL